MRVRGSGESSGGGRRRRFLVPAISFAVAAAVYLTVANPFVAATSGGDPYSVPRAVDINPAANIIETVITTEAATLDLGNGVEAHAQTFNGQIPGPTIEMNVGDTAIVHYRNDLNHESGIHWHGLELANAVDGQPYTQDMVPPGGSYIYKFTATRPGIYWYHPHHHSSTNQVLRGIYGMIVIEDPNEDLLRQFGVIPSLEQTKQIVLSDTTVCKEPGSNPGIAAGEPHAYDDNNDDTPAVTAPWAGSTVANSLPAQAEPSPKNLCEGPNVNAGGVENPYPIDEYGEPRAPFEAGDIPNIQTKLHAGRTNEGTIVLTNGRNVGARAGGPKDQGYVPGDLAPGASLLDVQPGQGLRLQIVNAATTRFMRLQLTDPAGDLVPLYRIGGEGGLLNSAHLEGGFQGGWDTRYTQGEVLLPPSTRADVVVAIPTAPTSGVLTLWAEDYERLGGGYVNTPTVPVMHLNLAGPTVDPAYKIENGTELRAATGDTISFLGAPTGTLLDPASFTPPKTGMGSETISLTANGISNLGINDVFGPHDLPGNYVDAPHLGSSRFAKEGDVLELTVEDKTGAHHPFHLHGFSFQPIKLDDAPYGPGGNDFTWTYPEYRDTIHIPPHQRLTFKVRLDPRPLADGVTPGGALGRWLFHCHIFFHHGNGMVSEVVVANPDGNERPYVNVDDAELSAGPGATASVTGTYKDPDGDPVSLTASQGGLVDHGNGRFTWTDPKPAPGGQLVYITATDSNGLKGQIPFYLEAGDPGPTPAPVAKLPAPGLVDEPPVLKSLKLTPKRFKTKNGTKIRFNLSEPASVQFTVKRIRPRKPKVQPPAFSRPVAKAGDTAIGFNGRLKRNRSLPPGKYRITATATDSGGLKSAPSATTFVILG
ncbi:MAG TPA: multicopper oxidase domain-containing protein [Solirubrobacterales bacterium]|nr:multicopper oxidase domain-containing protein [Solirubrobacterales bacterium]